MTMLEDLLSAPAQVLGFTPADSGSMTPESIETRRKLAMAMLQQGSQGGPVRGKLDGINRVLQSMLGTYQLKKLDEADTKGKKEADEALIAAFAPGTSLRSPGGGSKPADQPSFFSGGGSSPSFNQPSGPSPAIAGGDFDASIEKLMGTESGGNPNAKNPKSSATGLGQFIDSTWLATMKKHMPTLTQGKSDAQLLSLRTDANISREMTKAYARDNAEILERSGFTMTPGNLKLSHFAGPGGAVNVLRADPATPVTRLLTPSAIAANPFLRNWTAGDLRSWADKQMGGAAASAPVRTADASGATVSTDAPAGITLPGTAGNERSQRLQQQALVLMKNPRTATLGRELLVKAATTDPKDKPANIQEYEYAVRQGYNKTFNDWQLEQKTAGRSQTNVSVLGDQGFGKEFGKLNAERLDKQRGSAEGAIGTLSANAEARRALDDNAGSFTGAGADLKLGAARWAMSAGLIEPTSDTAKAVQNTETLVAQRGDAVLQSIKTLGANPSNADLVFLNKVKGANIELNEGTLRRLLDIEEKLARQSIDKFNTDLKKLAPEYAERLSISPPEPYKPTDKKAVNPDQPTPVKTQTIDPATGGAMKLPEGVTVDAARSQAQAALKARPDMRESIIQRLKSMGVSTEGL